MSALTVMTILSAALGSALPAFLPREYTHYAAVIMVRTEKGTGKKKKFNGLVK